MPVVDVDRLLKTLAPELAEGASEALERWHRFGDLIPDAPAHPLSESEVNRQRHQIKTQAIDRQTATPAESVGQLVGLLAGEQGARYLKPGEKFTRDGETVLHAVLRRLPIREGSVERLHSKLWLELGHLPAAEMATRVARRLEKDEFRGDLSDPPAMDNRARDVLAALRALGPLVQQHGFDESMLIRWGRQIGGRSPYETARAVLARLKTAHHAAGLTATGQPLTDDDVRKLPDLFTLDPTATRSLSGAYSRF